MRTVVIKTVDGNRYEVEEMPRCVRMHENNWLELRKELQRGTETKYVNTKMVVSITEREEV